MTDSAIDCWICGRPTNGRFNVDDSGITADCHWCGAYHVPGEVTANGAARALLPYLAAHIRQTSASLRFVVPGDWPDLARRHANSTVSQKVRKLLEWIAEGRRPGDWVEVEVEFLAPLIDAIASYEAVYLLRHVAELQYLRVDFSAKESAKRLPGSSGEMARIQMTVAGWEAVSPVAGTGISGTCFVAMSFDESLNAAYDEGMVKAIQTDCGFKVLRVDRVEHNDDITDRILAGIRSSQFVVADFTLQRQGVYFEAGFAAGLGRTVIWTCRNDDVDKLHFDTRQRNHVIWTTPENLRERLTQRIRATVTLPAELK